MTSWPCPDAITNITPHQREQVAKALSKRVGILGGNPGAGKTHAAAQIIKALLRRAGPAAIAVAAPTGKAAVRITAMMLEHGLEDIHSATTIHRLLGVSRNGRDQQGWGFIHNEENPLRQRFIFIDEASMLSVSLAKSLVEACQPGTHLLFIGDFAQLPPVEHGAPLRDMIRAGCPYGELTEVHRHGGAIIDACLALKQGRPFRPSPHIHLALGQNLKHFEARTEFEALRKLEWLLRNPPAEVDPVWGTQVLCAINEKSDMNRAMLNSKMQGILNTVGERTEHNPFRPEDKAICLTNGMLPLIVCVKCRNAEAETIEWDGKSFFCSACGRFWRVGDCFEDFVANGEIGRVILVGHKFIHVAFDCPRRTVRVAGERLKEFDLAYAVTTHKAQGSQWPVVVVMADNKADRVTSWEWWRTALSRAEKVCITIGQKATIDRQCRHSALATRKTFLTEILNGTLTGPHYGNLNDHASRRRARRELSKQ